MHQIPRHTIGIVLLAASLAVVGCTSDGHFQMFGYTTEPLYDRTIQTVFVPIAQNVTFRRGLEFYLTQAVIREIELKTPYKVVSDRACADTELTGNIISLTKQLLNRNQLNEIREAETVLTVGIVWKDLRTGEILSKPRKGPTALPTPGIPALDIPEVTGIAPPVPPPVVPPGAPLPPELLPVIVTGVGHYIPELGQSNTTAYQQAINRVAVQIVSLMEKPW